MEEKNEKYLTLLNDLNEAHILEGIKGFIIALKEEKFELAVASASKNAPLILKKIGLYKYFDIIVDPSSVRGKPFPDIFQKGAELLELNINECVGIEDSSAGIDAINDAGIFSIGIGDKEILGKADVVLKSTKLLSLDFINGL